MEKPTQKNTERKFILAWQNRFPLGSELAREESLRVVREAIKEKKGDNT